MPNFLVHIFNTLKQYDLLLALVFILAYWLLKRFISTTVINLAQVKSVATTRTMFIIRCFNIFSFILLF